MNFPVADAHCDFLYYMVQNGYDIKLPHASQAIALPYMRKGGVALQFFAAWTDTNLRTSCLQQCLDMIDAYWRMIDANSGDFVPFSSGFTPGNNIATLLTIEGGEALHGRIENLRLFYRLGVRALTLTWNYANELAYPAMRRQCNKGLTSLGKDIVKEMDRIGMALDVAHLNDAGIDDVLSLYNRPVFASHSNARAVCNHPRSLTDEHIRSIAQRGGVIAVNYYPPQLLKHGNACAKNVVEHIRHICDIGGTGCAALGSDFDGMCEYPKDLKNSADVPALLDLLMCNGFSESEVRGIAYDNLRNYIAKFV
ncbi:MAG: dipeptidase [Clostridia bacterium]